MTNMFRKAVSALFAISLAVSLMVLPACNSSTTTEDGAKDRYSYWKGNIPNTYYRLDINGDRGLQVTGKPFMKLEYDPVTGAPLKCEFGLSEVTQSFVEGHDIISGEPTLDASVISYADDLNIKSPVDLLVSWGTVTTNEALSGGGFEFWVRRVSWEEWHFSMTFTSMEGDVKNLDNNAYLGGDSDSKAMKLLKEFSASS